MRGLVGYVAAFCFSGKPYGVPAQSYIIQGYAQGETVLVFRRQQACGQSEDSAKCPWVTWFLAGTSVGSVAPRTRDHEWRSQANRKTEYGSCWSRERVFQPLLLPCEATISATQTVREEHACNVVTAQLNTCEARRRLPHYLSCVHSHKTLNVRLNHESRWIRREESKIDFGTDPCKQL